MQLQLTENEKQKITATIVAATKVQSSEEATKRKITYRNDNEPALLWLTDYIHSYSLRMIAKGIKDTGIVYSMRPHLGGIEVQFYKIK